MQKFSYEKSETQALNSAPYPHSSYLEFSPSLHVNLIYSLIGKNIFPSHCLYCQNTQFLKFHWKCNSSQNWVMVVASYDSLEQFFIKFNLKHFKIIKSPRKKIGLYQRGNKYLFFDWWNETLSIWRILAANIYWVFMPDFILRILHLVLRTTNENTEHERNKVKCLSTVVRIVNWQDWNPGGWPESLSK